MVWSIAALLSNAVREYVHIREEDCKVSVLQGTVEITNATLNTHDINGRLGDVPIALDAGFVSRLFFKIPSYTALRTSPVKLDIEGVYVCAHLTKLTGVMLRRRAAEAAVARLKQHLTRTLRDVSSWPGVPQEDGGTGWAAGLAQSIIRNMEIRVRDVHLRLEDTAARPGQPLAIGVTLRGLQSTKATFDGTTQHPNDTARNLVVEQCGVYFDTEHASAMPAGPQPGQLATYMPMPEPGDTHHEWVLQPTSLDAALLRPEAPNETQAQWQVQLCLHEARAVVKQSQLLAATFLQMHMGLHKFRPLQHVQDLTDTAEKKVVARNWLSYFARRLMRHAKHTQPGLTDGQADAPSPARSVASDGSFVTADSDDPTLQEKSTPGGAAAAKGPTPGYTKPRNNRMKRYMRLHEQRIRALYEAAREQRVVPDALTAGLSAAEQEEVATLESAFALNQIVFFRWLVQCRLQQAVEAGKLRAAPSKGWAARAASMFYSSTSAGTSTDSLLQAADWHAIYSSMESEVPSAAGAQVEKLRLAVVCEDVRCELWGAAPRDVPRGSPGSVASAAAAASPPAAGALMPAAELRFAAEAGLRLSSNRKQAVLLVHRAEVVDILSDSMSRGKVLLGQDKESSARDASRQVKALQETMQSMKLVPHLSAAASAPAVPYVGAAFVMCTHASVGSSAGVLTNAASPAQIDVVVHSQPTILLCAPAPLAALAAGLAVPSVQGLQDAVLAEVAHMAANARADIEARLASRPRITASIALAAGTLIIPSDIAKPHAPAFVGRTGDFLVRTQPRIQTLGYYDEFQLQLQNVALDMRPYSAALMARADVQAGPGFFTILEPVHAACTLHLALVPAALCPTRLDASVQLEQVTMALAPAALHAAEAVQGVLTYIAAQAEFAHQLAQRAAMAVLPPGLLPDDEVSPVAQPHAAAASGSGAPAPASASASPSEPTPSIAKLKFQSPGGQVCIRSDWSVDNAQLCLQVKQLQGDCDVLQSGVQLSAALAALEATFAPSSATEPQAVIVSEQEASGLSDTDLPLLDMKAKFGPKNQHIALDVQPLVAKAHCGTIDFLFQFLEACGWMEAAQVGAGPASGTTELRVPAIADAVHGGSSLAAKCKAGSLHLQANFARLTAVVLEADQQTPLARADTVGLRLSVRTFSEPVVEADLPVSIAVHLSVQDLQITDCCAAPMVCPRVVGRLPDASPSDAGSSRSLLQVEVALFEGEPEPVVSGSCRVRVAALALQWQQGWWMHFLDVLQQHLLPSLMRERPAETASRRAPPGQVMAIHVQVSQPTLVLPPSRTERGGLLAQLEHATYDVQHVKISQQSAAEHSWVGLNSLRLELLPTEQSRAEQAQVMDPRAALPHCLLPEGVEGVAMHQLNAAWAALLLRADDCQLLLSGNHEASLAIERPVWQSPKLDAPVPMLLRMRVLDQLQCELTPVDLDSCMRVVYGNLSAEYQVAEPADNAPKPAASAMTFTLDWAAGLTVSCKDPGRNATWHGSIAMDGMQVKYDDAPSTGRLVVVDMALPHAHARVHGCEELIDVLHAPRAPDGAQAAMLQVEYKQPRDRQVAAETAITVPTGYELQAWPELLGSLQPWLDAVAPPPDSKPADGADGQYANSRQQPDMEISVTTGSVHVRVLQEAVHALTNEASLHAQLRLSAKYTSDALQADVQGCSLRWQANGQQAEPLIDIPELAAHVHLAPSMDVRLSRAVCHGAVWPEVVPGLLAIADAWSHGTAGDGQASSSKVAEVTAGSEPSSKSALQFVADGVNIDLCLRAQADSRQGVQVQLSGAEADAPLLEWQQHPERGSKLKASLQLVANAIGEDGAADPLLDKPWSLGCQLSQGTDGASKLRANANTLHAKLYDATVQQLLDLGQAWSSVQLTAGEAGHRPDAPVDTESQPSSEGQQLTIDARVAAVELQVLTRFSLAGGSLQRMDRLTRCFAMRLDQLSAAQDSGHATFKCMRVRAWSGIAGDEHDLLVMQPADLAALLDGSTEAATEAAPALHCEIDGNDTTIVAGLVQLHVIPRAMELLLISALAQVRPRDATQAAEPGNAVEDAATTASPAGGAAVTAIDASQLQAAAVQAERAGSPVSRVQVRLQGFQATAYVHDSPDAQASTVPLMSAHIQHVHGTVATHGDHVHSAFTVASAVLQPGNDGPGLHLGSVEVDGDQRDGPAMQLSARSWTAQPLQCVDASLGQLSGQVELSWTLQLVQYITQVLLPYQTMLARIPGTSTASGAATSAAATTSAPASVIALQALWHGVDVTVNLPDQSAARAQLQQVQVRSTQDVNPQASAFKATCAGADLACQGEDGLQVFQCTVQELLASTAHLDTATGTREPSLLTMASIHAAVCPEVLAVYVAFTSKQAEQQPEDVVVAHSVPAWAHSIPQPAPANTHAGPAGDLASADWQVKLGLCTWAVNAEQGQRALLEGKLQEAQATQQGPAIQADVQQIDLVYGNSADAGDVAHVPVLRARGEQGPALVVRYAASASRDNDSQVSVLLSSPTITLAPTPALKELAVQYGSAWQTAQGRTKSALPQTAEEQDTEPGRLDLQDPRTSHTELELYIHRACIAALDAVPTRESYANALIIRGNLHGKAELFAATVDAPPALFPLLHELRGAVQSQPGQRVQGPGGIALQVPDSLDVWPEQLQLVQHRAQFNGYAKELIMYTALISSARRVPESSSPFARPMMRAKLARIEASRSSAQMCHLALPAHLQASAANTVEEMATLGAQAAAFKQQAATLEPWLALVPELPASVSAAVHLPDDMQVVLSQMQIACGLATVRTVRERLLDLMDTVKQHLPSPPARSPGALLSPASSVGLPDSDLRDIGKVLPRWAGLCNQCHAKYDFWLSASACSLLRAVCQGDSQPVLLEQPPDAPDWVCLLPRAAYVLGVQPGEVSPSHAVQVQHVQRALSASTPGSALLLRAPAAQLTLKVDDELTVAVIADLHGQQEPLARLQVRAAACLANAFSSQVLPYAEASNVAELPWHGDASVELRCQVDLFNTDYRAWEPLLETCAVTAKVAALAHCARPEELPVNAVLGVVACPDDQLMPTQPVRVNCAAPHMPTLDALAQWLSQLQVAAGSDNVVHDLHSPMQLLLCNNTGQQLVVHMKAPAEPAGSPGSQSPTAAPGQMIGLCDGQTAAIPRHAAPSTLLDIVTGALGGPVCVDTPDDAVHVGVSWTADQHGTQLQMLPLVCKSLSLQRGDAVQEHRVLVTQKAGPKGNTVVLRSSKAVYNALASPLHVICVRKDGGTTRLPPIPPNELSAIPAHLCDLQGLVFQPDAHPSTSVEGEVGATACIPHNGTAEKKQLVALKGDTPAALWVRQYLDNETGVLVASVRAGLHITNALPCILHFRLLQQTPGGGTARVTQRGHLKPGSEAQLLAAPFDHNLRVQFKVVGHKWSAAMSTGGVVRSLKPERSSTTCEADTGGSSFALSYEAGVLAQDHSIAVHTSRRVGIVVYTPCWLMNCMGKQLDVNVVQPERHAGSAASGTQDVVLDAVFENERKPPFGSFKPGQLLWSDRPQWSSADGGSSPSPSTAELSAALPPGWHWLDPAWQIDTAGALGPDGWDYELDFPFFTNGNHTYNPRERLQDYVRRRRWIRRRARDTPTYALPSEAHGPDLDGWEEVLQRTRRVLDLVQVPDGFHLQFSQVGSTSTPGIDVRMPGQQRRLVIPAPRGESVGLDCVLQVKRLPGVYARSRVVMLAPPLWVKNCGPEECALRQVGADRVHTLDARQGIALQRDVVGAAAYQFKQPGSEDRWSNPVPLTAIGTTSMWVDDSVLTVQISGTVQYDGGLVASVGWSKPSVGGDGQLPGELAVQNDTDVSFTVLAPNESALERAKLAGELGTHHAVHFDLDVSELIPYAEVRAHSHAELAWPDTQQLLADDQREVLVLQGRELNAELGLLLSCHANAGKQFTIVDGSRRLQLTVRRRAAGVLLHVEPAAAQLSTRVRTRLSAGLLVSGIEVSVFSAAMSEVVWLQAMQLNLAYEYAAQLHSTTLQVGAMLLADPHPDAPYPEVVLWKGQASPGQADAAAPAPPALTLAARAMHSTGMLHCTDCSVHMAPIKVSASFELVRRAQVAFAQLSAAYQHGGQAAALQLVREQRAVLREMLAAEEPNVPGVMRREDMLALMLPSVPQQDRADAWKALQNSAAALLSWPLDAERPARPRKQHTYQAATAEAMQRAAEGWRLDPVRPAAEGKSISLEDFTALAAPAWAAQADRSMPAATMPATVAGVVHRAPLQIDALEIGAVKLILSYKSGSSPAELQATPWDAEFLQQLPGAARAVLLSGTVLTDALLDIPELGLLDVVGDASTVTDMWAQHAARHASGPANVTSLLLSVNALGSVGFHARTVAAHAVSSGRQFARGIRDGNAEDVLLATARTLVGMPGTLVTATGSAVGSVLSFVGRNVEAVSTAAAGQSRSRQTRAPAPPRRGEASVPGVASARSVMSIFTETARRMTELVTLPVEGARTGGAAGAARGFAGGLINFVAAPVLGAGRAVQSITTDIGQALGGTAAEGEAPAGRAARVALGLPPTLQPFSPVREAHIAAMLEQHADLLNGDALVDVAADGAGTVYLVTMAGLRPVMERDTGRFTEWRQGIRCIPVGTDQVRLEAPAGATMPGLPVELRAPTPAARAHLLQRLRALLG